MNIRKPVDYRAMFVALDTLMTADLPQMKLYVEIGRLVSNKPEKGAAVAAAEYLCNTYPNVSGFSPRNLRRMREFYRTYENTPEVLAQAMTISWTQNVVILEAELTFQERAWYIQAAGQFNWSKLELTRNIRKCALETIDLDSSADSCYSNGNGGDEDGAKEPSGTFLQGLRDAEVQRELQRQGPCGAYLQSLFPPLTSTAGRTDDTPPPGKFAATPPERERNEVAEKSNPQSPARGEGSGLYGLCGTISPFGPKSEKAGTVHPNADTEQLLRIIQSIPSPKAEPFKIWLAQVGRERIEETIDPELTIDRALETYQRKGCSREWINQQLQVIQVRKELTDEWDARGVQQGIEYAILTDEISRAWSGMTTRQYKHLKGLKKENPRDSMTTLESVLNMLAEATTTELSREHQPETFEENKEIARRGGGIAGAA